MSAPEHEPGTPAHEPSAQWEAQVALATFAFLCYRLIFCTPREATFTALLFCAACAWCTGQLASGASATYGGLPSLSAASALLSPALAVVSAGASVLGSSVRLACKHAGLEAAARDTCWKLTEGLVSAPQD